METDYPNLQGNVAPERHQSTPLVPMSPYQD